MIKTLKSSNGGFANFGNPEVQCVDSDSDVDALMQPDVDVDAGSTIVRTSERSTGIQTMLLDSENSISSNDSISSMIDSMAAHGSSFIVPSLTGRNNHISLSSTADDSSKGYHGQSNTKRFDALEQLSGISKDRPEIIMLTNFLPMFDYTTANSSRSSLALDSNGDDVSMTDAGKFIDAQLQIRLVKRSNVKKLASRLGSKYPSVGKKVAGKNYKFKSKVDALVGHTDFLLQMVRSVEAIKSQLDLRNDLHIVDTREVSSAYARSFTSANAIAFSNSLIDDSMSDIDASFTPIDALVKIGYKENVARDTFCSSKIWLALMQELREIMVSHSMNLIEVTPTDFRRDSNASVIVRPNVDRFGVNVPKIGVPTISTLVARDPEQSEGSVNVLTGIMRSMYQPVQIRNDEMKISLLLNFLSKEFRYSYGLSEDNVRVALNERFNYNIDENGSNHLLFKAIFGAVPNDIADFPLSNGNSLSSIAQRLVGNDVGVLTFESKYIDADSGTLTPGSAYYIDSVLDSDGRTFATARMDELATLLGKSYLRLNLLANGMNLLAIKVSDPKERAAGSFTSMLANPFNLAVQLVGDVIDLRTGQTLPFITNDYLTSLYAFAAKNERVKAALFLFTMTRLAGYPQWVWGTGDAQPENTPLTDSMIDSILLALKSSTTSQPAQSNSYDGGHLMTIIDEGSIRFAFLAGTPMTRFVETTMQNIFNAFKKNNKAMNNGSTRYGNHVDTVVMMAAFDALMNIIAKYGNKIITSSTTEDSYGNLRYRVVTTLTKQLQSFNLLRNRLAKEVALTRQLMYAAMNSLKKLSSSLLDQVNFLNGQLSLMKLGEIYDVLGSKSTLKMLLNEQQITLNSSFIHDLRNRVNQKSGGGSIGSTTGDQDGDRDFDGDDEIMIVDDSVVNPKLKDALYGALGTTAFASKKGYNKKILTIGLPMGFASDLVQKISLKHLKRSSFASKQADIIRIVVNKVDLQNPDVVYKPKKYLFEMSRYAVRSDQYFLNVPDDPTISDVIKAIPTRDFGQSQQKLGEITYWIDPKARLAALPVGTGRALADESYDFLLDDQKEEIVRNHVMSFLLEAYVRLLTGMSVAEYNYEIEPVMMNMGEMNGLMMNAHVASVIDDKYGSSDDGDGVLFMSDTGSSRGSSNGSGGSGWGSTNSSGSNKKKKKKSKSGGESSGAYDSSPTTDDGDRSRYSSNIKDVPAKKSKMVIDGMKTVGDMGRGLTSISDSLAVSKKALMPKQFDRVFSIPVDPDDFEIDYDETVKTHHGKATMQQLMKNNDVVPITQVQRAASSTSGGYHASATSQYSQGRYQFSDTNSYKFRDRDRTQGDIAFEKYFVSVETINEEQV